MSSPARVVVAPRPSRSRSWTPSSSSRARMCSEIVGWVRKSASAAREKLEVLFALLAAILVDRHALLAAALHVALDELLGVLLEDVVDLVEELVDVFLDLLALLGQLRARGGSVATAFSRLRRPGLFLLLFCHLALHGTTRRVAKSERAPLGSS